MIPTTDKQGKFRSHDGRTRQVRGFRLANSEWELIRSQADALNCTPADLVALWCRDGCPVRGAQNSSMQEDTALNTTIKSAIALLENALTLKANSGGAIKAEIKKAIALLASD